MAVPSKTRDTNKKYGTGEVFVSWHVFWVVRSADICILANATPYIPLRPPVHLDVVDEPPNFSGLALVYNIELVAKGKLEILNILPLGKLDISSGSLEDFREIEGKGDEYSIDVSHTPSGAWKPMVRRLSTIAGVGKL